MRPRAGFTMIHPSAPLAGHRPRHKVLVVDDQADAADSLVLLLEQLGCETSVAYTALEAVREATTFLPTLVLLDLHMPQINGLDAARAIRACRLESKPVLVAVSADTRQHMLQASLEAGFDFHLSKPIPAGQIERMLRETLEHA